MENIPRALWSQAHHWLIWHGRAICKAPNPKCDGCFLTTSCFYFNRKGKWADAAVVAAERPVGKSPAKAPAEVESGSKAATKPASPKSVKTSKDPS